MGIKKTENGDFFEHFYRRWIHVLGSLIPWSFALFCIVTVLEGQFGFLSQIAGEAWITRIGRTASTVGGQGNLSARAILSMARKKMQNQQIHYVFSGDSVLAPPLGGGAVSDLPVKALSSSLLPKSLNVSQEGVEWATNSLLIRALEFEPLVHKQQPLLIVDIDLKFFVFYDEITPPFPTEMELCAEFTESPEFRALCKDLKEKWPKGLAHLYDWNPFLLEGLLGQFDFFLSFVLKAPIYSANVRGFGNLPYRNLSSGISDAAYLAEREKTFPTEIWRTTYRPNEEWLNKNAEIIWINYHSPQYRKYLWLNSLIKTVSFWPGPKLLVWIGHSPNAYAALTEINQKRMNQVNNEVEAAVHKIGIPNLKMIQISSVLNDAKDFIDMDHFTPQGHRKLAEFIQQNYNPEKKEWKH